MASSAPATGWQSSLASASEQFSCLLCFHWYLQIPLSWPPLATTFKTVISQNILSLGSWAHASHASSCSAVWKGGWQWHPFVLLHLYQMWQFLSCAPFGGTGISKVQGSFSLAAACFSPEIFSLWVARAIAVTGTRRDLASPLMESSFSVILPLPGSEHVLVRQWPPT